MKNNTYCLAQRVKAAAMLRPTLIEELLKKKTTNVKIVESTLRRLLPYRTSVEIECIGDYYSIGELIANDVNLKKRWVNNKNFKGNFDSDCEEIELQLSVLNAMGIIDLYYILEGLRHVCKVDKSGSIHIHVDVTNWLSNPNKEINEKRTIGILNLFKYGCSEQAMSMVNDILDLTTEKSNIDLIAFKQSTSDTNNSRTLSISAFGPYAITKLVGQRDLRNIDHDVYYVIREKRYKKGEIPFPSSKRNWINLRTDMYNSISIEIRTFKCSLNYMEIINFMLSANEIVKRILQYSEVLGNEAVKTGCILLK